MVRVKILCLNVMKERINTNRKFVKRKLSQKIKNYDIKNNCAIRKKKKF